MQSSKESNIIIDIVENNTIYFEMHEDLIKVLQGVVFQSEKDKPFNITIYDSELIEKINYNIEKFEDSFINGYNEFKNRWISSANTNDIRFWNSISYTFNSELKKLFYTKLPDFSEENIQTYFYNSGQLQAYIDFELENSMPLLVFTMLEKSNKLNFIRERRISKFEIPKPNKNNEIHLVPKVEFIILNETGFIDNLKAKSYNNNTIAKLVVEEIKKKYRNYTVIGTCSEKYIENILSADLHKPEPSNEKSAYKKKNIKDALQNLNEMGMHFENCKYFPTLKKEYPELFE